MPMEKVDHNDCKLCSREGELARIATKIESIEQRTGEIMVTQARTMEKLDRLIPAVARLEVKAGVWGGVGGLLAALLTAGLAIISRIWT